MQLIHTREAKAFLSHDFSQDGMKRPLLPAFLKTGALLISRGATPPQKNVIANHFMNPIEGAHTRLLRLLRPFLRLNGEPMFDGLDPMPALDPERLYSPRLMPAVDLVVDFDQFVALNTLYPHVYATTGTIEEATALVCKALSRIDGAAKFIESGKLGIRG
ncbi:MULTISPECIES: hypothetical protein [Pseudomonas]|uniref:Uncharacterized protein n=1 Tax=Pseudomonas fluorescens TaxID=294 RepID=A0A166QP52_PSEFL|nr:MULTISPECIES: hypothetical protein [Pseudomonas]KZN20624.1 hypothetical protein A1D17_03540 [Pseudomonas fluorescens]